MILSLYTVSTLVRLGVALTGDSYIHPDEHMQCGQVAAVRHLRYQIELPWEYRLPIVARSFVPVDILCGFPILILQQALNPGSITGFHIDRAIRLWMFLLSLADDVLVGAVAARLGANREISMLCKSMMWTTMVFSLHTFSNVLECLLLDVLFFIVTIGGRSSGLKAFLGGSILALGIFTRITFPAFAAPLILKTLVDEFYRASKKDWSPTLHVIKFIMLSAISTLIGCTVIISYDSWINGSLTIAPIANFLYNVQEDNLALHGLHPRWTHAALNIQILFTILPISTVYFAYVDFQWQFWFLYLSAIFPIVVLSAFPHQEFRFLLPLQTPFLLLNSIRLNKESTLFIVFGCSNVILAIFFGFLHQGGIAGGTKEVSERCTSDQCCLGGCEVYMIPTYLLGRNANKFRVFNNLNAEAKSTWEEGCDQVFILHPLLHSCGITNSSVVWQHGLPSFNAEAGGLIRLQLSTLIQ